MGNKIITLTTSKEENLMKSRSESVEKLMPSGINLRNQKPQKPLEGRKNLKNFNQKFYEPKFENFPGNKIQLPYINYETGYTESNPEFRSKQNHILFILQTHQIPIHLLIFNYL